MSVRDVGRRIPAYLACAILCFAMFDVPSAYAYWRGVPWGVALAVGVFVFPVFPVAWHVWSERNAKRAEKPKPRKTKGIERFVFRTIVVAVVAIGGLIAVARGRLWTALKNDALWFVPTSVGSLAPDSKLLDRVPPSAQFVVWVRPTDDANAMIGKLAPGTEVTEIVGAGRVEAKSGEAIVIERGALLIPMIERVQTMVLAFTAQNGVTIPERGSVISNTDGVKTWSTPGWTGDIGTGRPAVVELVRRAPDDAFIVAVAKVPQRPTPDPKTDAKTETKTDAADAVVAQGVTVVAWARAPREQLEIDATIETANEAAASQLLDEANREIAKTEKTHGKEMACWRKHSDELFVRREGAKLHAHMSIDVDGLKGLFTCLDMKSKM